MLTQSDHNGTLCLIQKYAKENEDLWKETKNMLSQLFSDYGHENVLTYLWSEKGKLFCQDFV